MSYVSEACRAPEALARDGPGRAQGAAASKLGGGGAYQVAGGGGGVRDGHAGPAGGEEVLEVNRVLELSRGPHKSRS
jgi:hypothetical protein